MAQKNTTEDNRRTPIQRVTLFLEVYGPDEYVDRQTGEVKKARAYFRASGVVGEKDDPNRTMLANVQADAADELRPHAEVLFAGALGALDKALTDQLRKGGR